MLFRPSRVIEVRDPQKPVVGILWESLREGMVERIPPLREPRALMDEYGCETSVELRGRR
ncbi:hypothetical protein BKA81DRAFT_350822 [Phyllosticta paracitricarpa]